MCCPGVNVSRLVLFFVISFPSTLIDFSTIPLVASSTTAVNLKLLLIEALSIMFVLIAGAVLSK